MLNKEQIRKLVVEQKLIEGCIKLETQLTPNGFDVTVATVSEFAGSGALDFSNSERVLPACHAIAPHKKKQEDTFGWWKLLPGAYKIRTNETVNLPNTLIALAYTRTSLLRMGAYTQHGVWDAGFHGTGEFILIVANPHGIELKQNCRIAQLVFVPVDETQGYTGIYNNANSRE
ncbi:MAG: deoxyuridine 5'-triphosphate nucleotidohydrolase [Candidatus Omnitrophota bacterium]